MISVGIIGGTGYTGKYIVKFINEHPYVTNYKIYANKSAGNTIHDIFPELSGDIINQEVQSVNDLDLGHDVYFLALPHGESLKYVSKLVELDKKVIDLGADFRLDDSEIFFKTYDLEHTSSNLLKEKHYGLAELNETYSHNLIANPGCYPTAALLSTIPIVKNFSNNIISISTISYSGLSGAGKKVSQSMLFSENYNSTKAYNVGTHRHEIEIIQELKKYGNSADYSLTTHLLPVFSGIYSTTIIHTTQSVLQTEIDELVNNLYLNSEFVRIRKTPPELKWVIGNNYCDLNFKSVGNKIIVTAAIDNLIKGAAGQAIQNMNKLYNLNESLGIKSKKEEFQNV